MKVYELAKELNLKSVELVDHLRKKWALPVKNHMQVLKEDDVQKVKKFFEKKQKKTGGVKKKKPVLKKTKSPETSSTESKTSGSVGIIRRRSKPSSPPASPSSTKKEEDSSELLKKSAASPSQHDTASSPSQAQTGRHIRPGLVTGASTDFLKKWNESTEPAPVEKKKAKKSAVEDQQRQFRATDFRKREIIFQPKKKRLTLGGEVSKKNQITKPKAHKRVVKMYETLSLKNLSHQIGVKQTQMVKKMKQESLWNKEQEQKGLDVETATLVASFFDFEVKNLSKTRTEIMDSLVFGNLSSEKTTKAPVVTVMGHVNHGKTSLLDYLRKSKTVQKEAGGITQHIGAYSVPAGKSFVTFIDTPGHKAFTAMRNRGVKVTDIVVLVVAADDGVQPQTVEAINHAKNAKVPVLVAINKIDSPQANLEQVKKQMMERGVVPEEWGGDSIFCPICALTGQGIKELLEHIQLLAEVHELKANLKRSAVGVVIESRMEKGRGCVMTLLLKDGTLKSGQVLVVGDDLGKTRQMSNDKGQMVSSACAGQAVEISGFNKPVSVGETFYAVKNEKEAKKLLSEKQKHSHKEEKHPELSLEDMLFKAHLDKKPLLHLILKADVVGSLEALKHSIEDLNTKEVEAKIIHSGLGDFNESDVLLADSAGALLLGFNVKAAEKVKKAAAQKDLKLKIYQVIYSLLEELEKDMAFLLPPEVKESPGGKAEVKQVFEISHLGFVAGCQVRQGKISSSHFARLLREDKILYEGRIHSLKRFKQSTKEVSEGQECGIGLYQHKDFQPGDIIESFLKTEIKRQRL